MCKYLSKAIDPTESDSNWSQAQQCQRFHETFETVFFHDSNLFGPNIQGLTHVVYLAAKGGEYIAHLFFLFYQHANSAVPMTSMSQTLRYH